MSTSLARWRTHIAGRRWRRSARQHPAAADRTGIRWHDPDRQDRRAIKPFGPGLRYPLRAHPTAGAGNAPGGACCRSSTSLTPPRLRAARDSMFTLTAPARSTRPLPAGDIAELLAPFRSASLASRRARCAGRCRAGGRRCVHRTRRALGGKMLGGGMRRRAIWRPPASTRWRTTSIVWRTITPTRRLAAGSAR